jgi:hypothetical protein
MSRFPHFVSSSIHVLTAIGLAVASPACGSTGDTQTPGETGGGENNPDGGGGGGGNAHDDASTNDPDAASNVAIAIPLTRCDAPVYSAVLSVGAQDFDVLVDTGSTTLGLAGSGCSTCGVTPLYTPGAGAVDQHKTASSRFGTGSWSGEIYQDMVGFKSDPTVPLNFVSINSQTPGPGSTTFFSANCGGKPFQGLLGFARAAAALANTDPFMDQMVADKGIPNVFATQLCDDGGTLWIGGYDPAATTAPPQYVPFTTGSLYAGITYTVNLATIDVGGTSVPIPSGSSSDTVLDTGTSVFLLNDAAFNQVTAAITADAGFQKTFGSAAASFFTISAQGLPTCGAAGMTKAALDAALPPLKMTFGSGPGVVVEAPATESYLLSDGSEWCNILVSESEAGQSLPFAALMGSPALRSSVTIFDRAKGQVGFAPHQPCKTSARPVEGHTRASVFKQRIRIPQVH